MVKIRLTRVGTRKQPKYRIIVIDEAKKRGSRYIEVLGNYNPMTEPSTVALNKERFSYWLSVGAKASKAVADLAKKK